MTKVMGCHIWGYIIEGCGIFLAGICPLVGLDEASEHAEQAHVARNQGQPPADNPMETEGGFGPTTASKRRPRVLWATGT